MPTNSYEQLDRNGQNVDVNTAGNALQLGGVEAQDYATKNWVENYHAEHNEEDVMDEKDDAVLSAAKNYTDLSIDNIDFSPYATNTDLAALKTELEGDDEDVLRDAKQYTDDKIGDIDFTPYATKIELQECCENAGERLDTIEERMGVEGTPQSIESQISDLQTDTSNLKRRMGVEGTPQSVEGRLDDLDDKYEELFQSASNGKTLIANAITGKGVPTQSDDTYQQMATNIGNIVTQGEDTSDATAEASDIVLGKTAYARGEKLYGTLIPSPQKSNFLVPATNNEQYFYSPQSFSPGAPLPTINPEMFDGGSVNIGDGFNPDITYIPRGIDLDDPGTQINYENEITGIIGENAPVYVSGYDANSGSVLDSVIHQDGTNYLIEAYDDSPVACGGNRKIFVRIVKATPIDNAIDRTPLGPSFKALLIEYRYKIYNSEGGYWEYKLEQYKEEIGGELVYSKCLYSAEDLGIKNIANTGYTLDEICSMSIEYKGTATKYTLWLAAKDYAEGAGGTNLHSKLFAFDLTIENVGSAEPKAYIDLTDGFLSKDITSDMISTQVGRGGVYDNNASPTVQGLGTDNLVAVATGIRQQAFGYNKRLSLSIAVYKISNGSIVKVCGKYNKNFGEGSIAYLPKVSQIQVSPNAWWLAVLVTSPYQEDGNSAPTPLIRLTWEAGEITDIYFVAAPRNFILLDDYRAVGDGYQYLLNYDAEVEFTPVFRKISNVRYLNFDNDVPKPKPSIAWGDWGQSFVLEANVSSCGNYVTLLVASIGIGLIYTPALEVDLLVYKVDFDGAKKEPLCSRRVHFENVGNEEQFAAKHIGLIPMPGEFVISSADEFIKINKTLSVAGLEMTTTGTIYSIIQNGAVYYRITGDAGYRDIKEKSYMESNGGQYIAKTFTLPTAGELEIIYKPLSNGNEELLFGATQDFGVYSSGGVNGQRGKTSFWYNNRGKTILGNTVVNQLSRIVISQNKIIYYADASSLEGVEKSLTRSVDLNIMLLRATSYANEHASAQIKSLKINDGGGNLLTDLEPRVVNGVPGFIDMVTGTFYKSNGTEFIPV